MKQQASQATPDTDNKAASACGHDPWPSTPSAASLLLDPLLLPPPPQYTPSSEPSPHLSSSSSSGGGSSEQCDVAAGLPCGCTCSAPAAGPASSTSRGSSACEPVGHSQGPIATAVAHVRLVGGSSKAGGGAAGWGKAGGGGAPDPCYTASKCLLTMAGVRLRQHRLEHDLHIATSD